MIRFARAILDWFDDPDLCLALAACLIVLLVEMYIN